MTFSTEQLKDITQDKDTLNQAIKDTHGHILFLLQKNQIFPNADYLLDNDYAIKFLLDNYELSRPQQYALSKRLNKDIENQVTSFKLTEQEIDELLTKHEVLPEHTILSFEQLNKHAHVLSDLYKNNVDLIEKIVVNSFENLSIDSLIEVEGILFNLVPPRFFSKKPELFYNTKFSEKYQNFVSYNLASYSNFIFKDKQLLKNVIVQTPYMLHVKYNDLSFSARALIGKMEYFKLTDRLDISSFTKKEIEDNKKQIQNHTISKIVKQIKENNNGKINDITFKELSNYIGEVEGMNEYNHILFDTYFAEELIVKLNRIKMLNFVIINVSNISLLKLKICEVILSNIEKFKDKIDINDIDLTIKNGCQDYRNGKEFQLLLENFTIFMSDIFLDKPERSLNNLALLNNETLPSISLENLVLNNQWETIFNLNLSQGKLYEVKEHIADILPLKSFDELLNLFEDKDFIYLLTESVMHKHDCFDKFLDKEKEIIFHLAYETMGKSAFYLFSDFNFIKNHLIKNPTVLLSANEHIIKNCNFTNNEVIEIFNNLEKKDLFLDYKIRNDFGDFLNTIFSYQNNRGRYFQMLDLEEINPQLYFLLCNSTILDRLNPALSGERNEFMNDFIAHNFDLDKLKEGFKVFLDKLKKVNFEIDTKEYDQHANKLMQDLDDFIKKTSYFDIKKDAYSSHFTTEQSKDLLMFIIKELPPLLLDNNFVGNINVIEYFEHNNLLDKNVLNDVLFNNVYKLHLVNIDYPDAKGNDIADSMIKSYIKNNITNKETIEVLSYQLENHRFMSNYVVITHPGYKFVYFDKEAKVINYLSKQDSLLANLNSIVQKLSLEEKLSVNTPVVKKIKKI